MPWSYLYLEVLKVVWAGVRKVKPSFSASDVRLCTHLPPHLSSWTRWAGGGSFSHVLSWHLRLPCPNCPCSEAQKKCILHTAFSYCWAVFHRLLTRHKVGSSWVQLSWENTYPYCSFWCVTRFLWQRGLLRAWFLDLSFEGCCSQTVHFCCSVWKFLDMSKCSVKPQSSLLKRSPQRLFQCSSLTFPVMLFRELRCVWFNSEWKCPSFPATHESGAALPCSCEQWALGGAWP